MNKKMLLWVAVIVFGLWYFGVFGQMMTTMKPATDGPSLG